MGSKSCFLFKPHSLQYTQDVVLVVQLPVKNPQNGAASASRTLALTPLPHFLPFGEFLSHLEVMFISDHIPIPIPQFKLLLKAV